MDIADFEVKVGGEIEELAVVACPERQRLNHYLSNL